MLSKLPMFLMFLMFLVFPNLSKLIILFKLPKRSNFTKQPNDLQHNQHTQVVYLH